MKFFSFSSFFYSSIFLNSCIFCNEIFFLYSVPDLNEGLKDAKKIFEVFFNNDFDEAFDMCTKYEKYNLYYSHVKTFLKFMYALFSLTPVS